MLSTILFIITITKTYLWSQKIKVDDLFGQNPDCYEGNSVLSRGRCHRDCWQIIKTQTKMRNRPEQYIVIFEKNRLTQAEPLIITVLNRNGKMLDVEEIIFTAWESQRSTICFDAHNLYCELWVQRLLKAASDRWRSTKNFYCQQHFFL